MKYNNPVISTNNHRVTSPFGKRTDPITGQAGVQHDGVDIVDAQGLQRTTDVWIIAIADGVVVDKHNSASIGHGIDLLHAGNILTRQYHFKIASTFKVGDKVKRGDRIGIMGTTGKSTGIHLHFAVKINSTKWNNGTYVDPMPYLTGEKVISGTTASAAPVVNNVSEYEVVITADSLNIRSGAGTNFPIAGSMKKNATGVIVAESTGTGATKWGRLKNGTGWISLDFVTMKTAAAPTPAATTKSVDEIAREVIAGKWSTGQDRVNRLTAAGYNASAVQKRVNELLK